MMLIERNEKKVKKLQIYERIFSHVPTVVLLPKGLAVSLTVPKK